jgi:hypothetical protein
MIHDIVGTGIYAVPSSDITAQSATSGLRTLLFGDPGVPGLAVGETAFSRAWVVDSQTSGGEHGTRSLAFSIAGFTYSGVVCPTEAAVDAMTSAIRSVLLAASVGGTITALGSIEVNLFDAGSVGP